MLVSHNLQTDFNKLANAIISFISANSNLNLKILTQGANVQVATYLTNSDTLEIVRNVGSGDTVQCIGQCSDCSYQYRMQVCSSLYVSLLDSVTS